MQKFLLKRKAPFRKLFSFSFLLIYDEGSTLVFPELAENKVWCWVKPDEQLLPKEEYKAITSFFVDTFLPFPFEKHVFLLMLQCHAHYKVFISYWGHKCWEETFKLEAKKGKGNGFNGVLLIPEFFTNHLSLSTFTSRNCILVYQKQQQFIFWLSSMAYLSYEAVFCPYGCFYFLWAAARSLLFK